VTLFRRIRQRRRSSNQVSPIIQSLSQLRRNQTCDNTSSMMHTKKKKKKKSSMLFP
jgi:hypothetical protein